MFWHLSFTDLPFERVYLTGTTLHPILLLGIFIIIEIKRDIIFLGHRSKSQEVFFDAWIQLPVQASYREDCHNLNNGDLVDVD